MGPTDENRLAILAELAAIVATRGSADAETSYTASLLAGGVERCARKFGEEAVELVLAAVSGDGARTASETADVLYHLLVLLEAADVPLDDVLDALERRRGMGGHEEKASRAGRTDRR